MVGDPAKSRTLNVGDEVEIAYRLSGRRWQKDEKSEAKYFVNVEAMSFKLLNSSTDTMTETAKLLSSIEGKTIVFTGSMYPAKFLESDAVFNIGCAVTAAQILPPGVCHSPSCELLLRMEFPNHPHS